jgi:hypothetical protein
VVAKTKSSSCGKWEEQGSSAAAGRAELDRKSVLLATNVSGADKKAIFTKIPSVAP